MIRHLSQVVDFLKNNHRLRSQTVAACREELQNIQLVATSVVEQALGRIGVNKEKITILKGGILSLIKNSGEHAKKANEILGQVTKQVGETTSQVVNRENIGKLLEKTGDITRTTGNWLSKQGSSLRKNENITIDSFPGVESVEKKAMQSMLNNTKAKNLVEKAVEDLEEEQNDGFESDSYTQVCKNMDLKDFTTKEKTSEKSDSSSKNILSSYGNVAKTAAAASLASLYQQTGKLQSIFSSASEATKIAASDATKIASNYLSKKDSKDKGISLTNKLSSLTNGIFNRVKGVTNKASNGINGVFFGLTSKVSDTISGTYAKLVKKLNINIWKLLYEYFKKLLSSQLSFINKLWKRFKFFLAGVLVIYAMLTLTAILNGMISMGDVFAKMIKLFFKNDQDQ